MILIGLAVFGVFMLWAILGFVTGGTILAACFGKDYGVFLAILGGIFWPVTWVLTIFYLVAAFFVMGIHDLAVSRKR